MCGGSRQSWLVGFRQAPIEFDIELLPGYGDGEWEASTGEGQGHIKSCIRKVWSEGLGQLVEGLGHERVFE